MKKAIPFAVLLLLLAAGAAVYFHFQRQTDDPASVWSAITANFPSAELATRTLCWQCVISETNDFPARYFVIGRTATVKAGFDLAKVDPVHDLAVDDAKRIVALKLPPPEVLSVAWGENRILLEKHSVAAAVVTKSGEEENRRMALFNAALLDDAKNNDLLDFDTLSEGIYRYLAPWVKRFGYRLIVYSPERTTFADALAAYAKKHP
ncbi:MAG: DUF4230 domain-containing protein [Victivallaceae bacterium]|nr:DUF4230 domain-containing protein [Victivallaceae bacterium]